MPRVSIHAPARGATKFLAAFFQHEERFNPRAREGRDLLRRADGAGDGSFNPRAREGRDGFDAI